MAAFGAREPGPPNAELEKRFGRAAVRRCFPGTRESVSPTLGPCRLLLANWPVLKGPAGLECPGQWRGRGLLIIHLFLCTDRDSFVFVCQKKDCAPTLTAKSSNPFGFGSCTSTRLPYSPQD